MMQPGNNTGAIDKAFKELIHTRTIYKKLRMSPGHVRTIRYNLKHGLPVSTDLKLKLLQRSGWRQDDFIYNRKDLVSLAQSILKAGTMAKEFGAEYLVEKWEALKHKQ